MIEVINSLTIIITGCLANKRIRTLSLVTPTYGNYTYSILNFFGGGSAEPPIHTTRFYGLQWLTNLCLNCKLLVIYVHCFNVHSYYILLIQSSCYYVLNLPVIRTA